MRSKVKNLEESVHLLLKFKDINPPYVDLNNDDKVDISVYPQGKMAKYKIKIGDYVIAHKKILVLQVLENFIFFCLLCLSKSV